MTADEIELDRLRRLRAGDETLFVTLVHELSPAMLRLARLHVSNREGAEDVVQDAWIVVMRRLDAFEERSSLQSWIFGIVLNLARTHRRRDARTLPFSSVWRAHREPAVALDRFVSGSDPIRGGAWSSTVSRWDLLPETELESGETREVLRQAIKSLPRDQRGVLVARDIDGLPAAQVCSLFGIVDARQRQLLHRARTRVRHALEVHFQSGSG